VCYEANSEATWLAELAGILVKIKDGLKIEKQHCFILKNRLKTRVALLELLDLSDIAVGNVKVPTCLKLVSKSYKKVNTGVLKT
jgi:hypothetical protein